MTDPQESTRSNLRDEEVPNTAAPGKSPDDIAKKATAQALEVVEKDPLFRQAGEAGITVGLVSLLLFLRIFAVARWQWDTAASLAEALNFDDAISILLGTLFERPSISGLLIIVALPLAIFRDYWLASSKVIETRANNWFLIVALVATGYVLTRALGLWWLFPSAGAITAVLLLISVRAKRRGWSRSVARIGAHIGLLFGLALVALASTLDTPWLDRERIVTDEQTIFGYVLDTNPGFLKIMTEDRNILIIPDDDVVSRTVMN